jgi:hypothetical protein
MYDCPTACSQACTQEGQDETVHGLHRLVKFDEGGVLSEFMGLSDASDEGGVDGCMMVQCGTAGQETTTLNEL